MKKLTLFLATLSLILILCAGGQALESSMATQTPSQQTHENSRVLIAYYSNPEDVSTDGVDAIAGASIVVKDGEVLGNTEYVANLVQRTIGGDLFSIETLTQYPQSHDALVQQVADEQQADFKPALATHIDNIDQYDIIILGFPNWWADLPRPLYTFLEEYDLGAKTIIPFTVHGGSGFSDMLSTLSRLQPNAHVSDQTLSLSRNDAAYSEEAIVTWAQSLALNGEETAPAK